MPQRELLGCIANGLLIREPLREARLRSITCQAMRSNPRRRESTSNYGAHNWENGGRMPRPTFAAWFLRGTQELSGLLTELCRGSERGDLPRGRQVAIGDVDVEFAHGESSCPRSPGVSVGR
jgi:hypothetical protein